VCRESGGSNVVPFPVLTLVHGVAVKWYRGYIESIESNYREAYLYKRVPTTARSTRLLLSFLRRRRTGSSRGRRRARMRRSAVVAPLATSFADDVTASTLIVASALIVSAFVILEAPL